MIPKQEGIMGLYDDWIGDKIKWVATQAAHKAEVKSLNAALKQKDATIQTMEKHVGLLQEKEQIVETQYQGLQDQVNELQGNLARLVVNHPPTIDLINDTTASAISVFSSSEKLGSTLDEMSESTKQIRAFIGQQFRGKNPPVKIRTLLSEFMEDEDDKEGS